MPKLRNDIESVSAKPGEQASVFASILVAECHAQHILDMCQALRQLVPDEAAGSVIYAVTKEARAIRDALGKQSAAMLGEEYEPPEKEAIKRMVSRNNKNGKNA